MQKIQRMLGVTGKSRTEYNHTIKVCARAIASRLFSGEFSELTNDYKDSTQYVEVDLAERLKHGHPSLTDTLENRFAEKVSQLTKHEKVRIGEEISKHRAKNSKSEEDEERIEALHSYASHV